MSVVLVCDGQGGRAQQGCQKPFRQQCIKVLQARSSPSEKPFHQPRECQLLTSQRGSSLTQGPMLHSARCLVLTSHPSMTGLSLCLCPTLPPSPLLSIIPIGLPIYFLARKPVCTHTHTHKHTYKHTHTHTTLMVQERTLSPPCS